MKDLAPDSHERLGMQSNLTIVVLVPSGEDGLCIGVGLRLRLRLRLRLGLNTCRFDRQTLLGHSYDSQP